MTFSKVVTDVTCVRTSHVQYWLRTLYTSCQRLSTSPASRSRQRRRRCLFSASFIMVGASGHVERMALSSEWAHPSQLPCTLSKSRKRTAVVSMARFFREAGSISALIPACLSNRLGNRLQKILMQRHELYGKGTKPLYATRSATVRILLWFS